MLKLLYAFLVGGIICVIGQILLQRTKLGSPKILVLFVTLGVLLGGLGLYQPLVDFAGAGASVPLLGFGNTLAKGAIKAAQEKGVIGALSGGMTAAAAGVSAAILFALVAALIFNPKTKK